MQNIIFKTCLKLYHSNIDHICRDFVDGNIDLIKSVEDGHWLGDGMYFWDNLSNAKYWKKRKEKDKRNANNKILIIESIVFLDNLLDLSDLDICNKIEELHFKIYSRMNNRNYNIYRELTLGYKLNLIYEKVPDFYKKYNVIKIIAKYNNSPKNKLYNFSVNNSKIEPTSSVKTIYNVKSKEAIGYKCIREDEYYG